MDRRAVVRRRPRALYKLKLTREGRLWPTLLETRETGPESRERARQSQYILLVRARDGAHYNLFFNI